MNYKNNRHELSERSIQILDGIMVLASDYANIINILQSKPKPRNALQIKISLSVPYTVLIYGKMVTFNRLLNGFSFEDVYPKVIGVSQDMITVYDIIRSIYESILQSNFMLSQYCSEQDADYFLRWFNSRAYSERRKMASTSNLQDPQLDKESKEIVANSNFIKSHYLLQLTNDLKRYREDKQTGLPNWPKPSDLYKLASIHESHHNFLYKFMSIYAHSEPLSVLQAKDLINGKSLGLDSSILHHGVQVLNLCYKNIGCLANSIPEVNAYVLKKQELANMIDNSNKYFFKSREEIKNEINKGS